MKRVVLLVSAVLLVVIAAIVIPPYFIQDTEPTAAPTHSITPPLAARLRSDFPTAKVVPAQVRPPARPDAEKQLAASRDELRRGLDTLPPESATRQAVEQCMRELDPLLKALESDPSETNSQRAYDKIRECQAASEKRVEELKARAAAGDEQAKKELSEEEKVLHFLADACYVVSGVLYLTPYAALAPLWAFAGALIDGISCVFFPDSCRPGDVVDQVVGGQEGPSESSQQNGWIQNTPSSEAGKAAMAASQSNENVRVVGSKSGTGDWFLEVERTGGSLAVLEATDVRIRIQAADVEAAGVDVKAVLTGITDLIAIRDPSANTVVRFMSGTAEYALLRSGQRWVLQPWSEYKG